MRTRNLLLAVSLMALAGCGDPRGMTNQQIVNETKFCLENKLDPVVEKTWAGDFTIICAPPELTMMQKLEFMTWVRERDSKVRQQEAQYDRPKKVSP